MKIMDLPIDKVQPDPNQPRRSFNQKKIEELANSIREHGLLQPILVRPIGNNMYQIVHGERRWRACQILGLKTIRAEIRNLSENEVLEIQLIENLQREDLNPIEEAATFQRMVNELGYTHEEIAQKIGKSREYVTNKLRLLKLPDSIKNALKNGKISEGHARTLLTLEENKQLEVFDQILNKGLTVRQTEELVISKTRSSVLRETLDVPKDGLIVGVWVSSENYQKLEDIAKSKQTSIERLCSQIVEEAIKNVR